MARRRNKSEERDTAVRRIDSLLSHARVELMRRQVAGTPMATVDLPSRYGNLALRVAEKFQTGLAPAQKALICRKCGAFRSIATSRTRLRSGCIAVHCLLCGNVARRPLAIRPIPSTTPSQPATKVHP